MSRRVERPLGRVVDAEDAARTFWKAVEKSAAAIRDEPDWLKAGITLNPENFVTYGVEAPVVRPRRKKRKESMQTRDDLNEEWAKLDEAVVDVDDDLYPDDCDTFTEWLAKLRAAERGQIDRELVEALPKCGRGFDCKLVATYIDERCSPVWGCDHHHREGDRELPTAAITRKLKL